MAKYGTKQLTLDQAYQAAYLWLDHAGDPPIEISEPSHGAVELITEQAFVRVRSSESPVEQSSVLALLRAAQSGKRLVIFSPSGFSPGAKSIAETQGIALYSLDSTGRAIAETTHARSIAPDTEPDPPFAPTDEDTSGDFWARFSPSTSAPSPAPDGGQAQGGPILQAGTTDWADCPNCGATHYRNAKFCRECGKALAGGNQVSAGPATPGPVVPSKGSAPSHGSSGSHLRCKACGSHDIELIE